jgi:hypothetical protein
VFEHTAFRLEVRDRYDASYENESMRRFLAGEQDDLPWMQSWLVMLRDLTAQGRDDEDRFRGGELIEDPAVIVQYNYWRDAARHKAVRRDDFAAQQHIGLQRS